MTVREQILEQLKTGPKTSTEIAGQTGVNRGAVKVALVTMVKNGMVARDRIDRSGKGPKTAYCYRLSV
jgi:DNA-binding IclR family transcriptional regulator